MSPTHLSLSQARAERATWIEQKFRQAFPAGPRPAVVRAPGRVNLIGEHTDYNDGFVFPLAIDRDIVMAGRPSPSTEGRIELCAVDYEQSASLALADLEKERRDPSPEQPGWARYVYGVIWAFRQAGFPVGAVQAAFSGNIPQGAGLSSSAALEVATATLLEHLFHLQVEGPRAAALCQQAENQYVGVNCGIMDQFISRLGRQETALLLDCRSLEYRWIPLPQEQVSVVICNTAVRRGLVDSAFNQRRAECEQGVHLLQQADPNVRQLRDVTAELLRAHAPHLPPTIARRVQHVVEENARVLQTVDALSAGDWRQVGQLLNASHESLRDLYEVSSPALDLMVELARAVPGVYGARMTGAGFGGCTVNLVQKEAVPRFLETVIPAYCQQIQQPLSGKPEAYVCRADDGALVLQEFSA
ncbi:MAG: galactokinase [Limnochordaceae bacterium]|nr:galactokinase [Limnochordaceae bacterium]